LEPSLPSTIVGIAGITGRIGHLIGKSLVANPELKVRGYGRHEKRLHSDLQGKVQFIPGQADDWKALRAFVRGCDVIVCT
jgi:nucleoside-diphosphate-sugar epimerase